MLFSSHQTVTAHSHYFSDMFSAQAKTLQHHNFQKPTPLTTCSLSLLCIYVYTVLYIHTSIYRYIFTYT